MWYLTWGAGHQHCFSGGSVDKESACHAGDTGDVGSIPGLGRSHGEGNGNFLQDSCLENPMGRGAWQATAQRVAKSRTRLSTQAQQLQIGKAKFLVTVAERLRLPIFCLVSSRRTEALYQMKQISTRDPVRIPSSSLFRQAPHPEKSVKKCRGYYPLPTTQSSGSEIFSQEERQSVRKGSKTLSKRIDFIVNRVWGSSHLRVLSKKMNILVVNN